jgi:hypothetical protein
MELAALIAGVALATFPYSAEFNGKIKYIRDFFITLFFAGLGMQIPVPSFEAILKAFVIAVVVMIVRWLGIFLLVVVLSRDPKIASLATINLSQISEFALVICKFGMDFGHIEADTLTFIIWTFAILAILASYMIGYNDIIYKKLVYGARKCLGRATDGEDGEEEEDEHEHRDIIMLGFHKIAFMLVEEFAHKNPQMLNHLHIIDFKQEHKKYIEGKGIKFSYGDISTPDVLEHCNHGEPPRLVLSTIPDSNLRGATNAKLVRVAKEVWSPSNPNLRVIATADNPLQASQLYDAGANYVLRVSKLCAERLYDLLLKHSVQSEASELHGLFEHYKRKDKDVGRASFMVMK